MSQVSEDKMVALALLCSLPRNEMLIGIKNTSWITISFLILILVGYIASLLIYCCLVVVVVVVVVVVAAAVSRRLCKSYIVVVSRDWYGVSWSSLINFSCFKNSH